MHTVEKIGGTSMSRFRELMDTILIGERTGETLYNRIFVVSAYGGITNLLLEHKKTGEPGVYARFANAENESAWREALTDVRARMADINLELFGDSVERAESDRFITQRITDVESIMSSLQQLCSHGHFQLDEHLMKVREMLAAIELEAEAEQLRADLAEADGALPRQCLGWCHRLLRVVVAEREQRALVFAAGWRCRQVPGAGCAGGWGLGVERRGGCALGGGLGFVLIAGDQAERCQGDEYQRGAPMRRQRGRVGHVTFLMLPERRSLVRWLRRKA